MMDLGAGICTPRRPACALCPVDDACRARADGTEERYPIKAPKTERPTRYGDAFVAVRSDGAVLLRARADNGLLGGMSEVPGSEWTSRRKPLGAPSEILIQADWRPVPGAVVHVFTHFRLELNVYCGRLATMEQPPPGHWWSSPEALPGEALPSVMKKVVEAALPGATRKPAKKDRAA